MRALTGLAAVVAVAIIGWLLWPSAAGPTVLVADTGAHAVRLEMPRPHLGANDVRLEITGAGGGPAELTSVTVEPAMPRMGHAIPPVPAVRDGAGYRVADLPLVMGGQWVITVTLHGPDGPEQVDFPLLVNG